MSKTKGYKGVYVDELTITVLGKELVVQNISGTYYGTASYDAGDYWTPEDYEEEIEDVEINEYFVYEADSDFDAEPLELTGITEELVYQTIKEELLDDDYASDDGFEFEESYEEYYG